MKRGFTLIELLVVMGIAAMLITMASTSFFGALRQESVTKSRNQLRDVLLLARQQASILGRTHVVVCWNVDTKIKVGNSTQNAKQGKFALFEAVGDAYVRGNSLYAPFKLDADRFSTLKKNSRVISLESPDAAKFAKLTDITKDATKSLTEIENGKESANIDFTYAVAGSEKKISLPMEKVASFTGTLQKSSSGKVPLAVRASQTYALPKYYSFSTDRTVFIFKPDGSVDRAGSVIAAHSVAKSSKNATYTVTINAAGEISLK